MKYKKWYGSEETKSGARNYARKFYNSGAWKKRRKAYRKTHPLCERCLKKGIFEKSTCVHHIIHIDEKNYTNPDILFGENNLEALCDLCHAKEHADTTSLYEFDPLTGMLVEIKRRDEE